MMIDHIETTQSGAKANKRVFLLSILLVTLAAFSSSLNNDYTNWDDQAHFLKNTDVSGLNASNLAGIFKNTVNRTFIPLTTLSFALEHHFFGFNPLISHGINLFFHLAVTAMVFSFALRVNAGIYAAGLSALLFGVHPMHVESVAWITERKDVLYAFFYMLALNHYIVYTDTFKKRPYALSVVFGFLSVLAKPMALSLPLILFACDWIKKRKLSVRLFVEKIPYFLLIGSVALITYALNARVIENDFRESVLLWFWSLSFYVQKFLFPVHLSPLYKLPLPVDLTNFAYGWSLIFIAINIGIFIVVKNNRWFKFAWIYYFLSVFFLLRYDNSVDIGIVADRFMYLPSLGFCLLFGLIAVEGWNRIKQKPQLIKWAGCVCLIGLFILLSAKTFSQCNVWSNGVTLWSDVIRTNPLSPLANYNRGKAHEIDGQYDLALTDFNNAIELKEDYADAYSNRGNIYAMKGQYGLALDDFNRAVEYEPDSVESYNNRGNAYYYRKEYELALADFNKAASIDPDFEKTYNNRGLVYTDKKLYPLALSDFDRALDLDRNDVNAFYNRGNVFKLMVRYELALNDYAKALELDPGYLKAYINRGNVYGAMQKYDQAIENYTMALKIDPVHYEVLNNRGIAYQWSEQYVLALEDFNRAIAINPDFAGAYAGRGNVHSIQGQFESALKDYTRALEADPNLVSVYYHRSMAYAAVERYQEALEDAQKAKSLGYPELQVYIAKLGKLLGL